MGGYRPDLMTKRPPPPSVTYTFLLKDGRGQMGTLFGRHPPCGCSAALMTEAQFHSLYLPAGVRLPVSCVKMRED